MFKPRASGIQPLLIVSDLSKSNKSVTSEEGLKSLGMAGILLLAFVLLDTRIPAWIERPSRYTVCRDSNSTSCNKFSQRFAGVWVEHYLTLVIFCQL